MNLADKQQQLLRAYMLRDINQIVEIIPILMKDETFLDYYEKLVQTKDVVNVATNSKKTTKILLEDLERRIRLKKSNDAMFESFYSIADKIKAQFSVALGEIYLNTVVPPPLLADTRLHMTDEDRQDENVNVATDAIERYKAEWLRLENGRKTILVEQQKYSHFPAKNIAPLKKALQQAQKKLLGTTYSNSLKPLFVRIAMIDRNQATELEFTKQKIINNYYLIDHYILTGKEPPLWQQVELYIMLTWLLKGIEQINALPKADYKALKLAIDEVINFHSENNIRYDDYMIIVDTLAQVIIDKNFITRRLARTFISEYQSAEKQMMELHWMVETQLADIRVFLEQMNPNDADYDDEQKEKVRIAEEKVLGLDGIFDIEPHMQLSMTKDPIALERVALGMPTTITVEQLIKWITSYSIVFANSDFVEAVDAEIDFKPMRKYISNLSTYHLIQNISLLRRVVENALTVSDEEKENEFKKFNNALKVKLQSLIQKNKSGAKSINEMIEELGFIKNTMVQFLIAETLKGFQAIVNSFELTAMGDFVKDKEALQKESKTLYDQICSLALRNFMHLKPIIRQPKKAKKKGIFGRIFSIFRKK